MIQSSSNEQNDENIFIRHAHEEAHEATPEEE